MPWTAHHRFLNFAEMRRDPASFWAEEAYEQLRRIKAAVDPNDLHACFAEHVRRVQGR